MNKYIVRIRSSCFEDIEIIAKTKKEAIELAMLKFRGDCPEFEEIIYKEGDK